MEKATDILAYLGVVLAENTQQYQSDFEYDKKMLREAALKPKAEDRTFYWMSRPGGTWCFKERDVFIRDTEPNITWRYYESESNNIRAFRVLVSGIDENGKLIGDIQPFHYLSQVQRVNRSALPLHQVTGFYEDGTPFVAPKGNFNLSELHEHGGIHEKHYEPENELELANTIAWEHRAQERPAIRGSRIRKTIAR